MLPQMTRLVLQIGFHPENRNLGKILKNQLPEKYRNLKRQRMRLTYFDTASWTFALRF